MDNELMHGRQKGNLFARDFKRGRMPTLEANINRAIAGSPVTLIPPGAFRGVRHIKQVWVSIL